LGEPGESGEWKWFSKRCRPWAVALLARSLVVVVRAMPGGRDGTAGRREPNWLDMGVPGERSEGSPSRWEMERLRVLRDFRLEEE
jgi:hypothetical protein